MIEGPMLEPSRENSHCESFLIKRKGINSYWPYRLSAPAKNVLRLLRGGPYSTAALND